MFCSEVQSVQCSAVQCSAELCSSVQCIIVYCTAVHFKESTSFMITSQLAGTLFALGCSKVDVIKTELFSFSPVFSHIS